MYSSQICHYLNLLSAMLGTKKGCCGLTQQADKLYSTAHTPYPQEGFLERTGRKNTKFVNSEKDSSKGQKRNGEIPISDYKKISGIKHNSSTPIE